MKKIVKIGIGILLAIIIAGILLFSILNKEKISITAKEFKNIMERKEYTVADATSQFEEYEFVKKVYIATDGKYKFEFYEFSSDEDAINFYNNNKSIFENQKGNSSGETYINGKNYSKYTLTTDGKYKCVSRINNTAMFINIENEYKDDLKEVLKDLDY